MTDAAQPTAPDERPSSVGPAWSPSELRDSPHARSDKADRVRSMFAAIARSYDLNNRLHSFGRDQAWRRAAVRAAGVRPGDAVLDCACGTGDLTHAFARTDASRVVGLDFTQEMLDLAGVKRAKLPEAIAHKVSYLRGDAMELPFESGSFDVVSIAFGIRNVQEPARAVAEFARVLRPGGRLVILEFDRPRFAPVRWGNDLYTKVIMPRTAAWIARDRVGAYRYLPKSVETFLSRAQMIEMFASHGFEEVRARSLTLGVCACYRGVRAG
ncbi:MAG: bifunctional demethylmenaquinone methyltransferase/2-methoxy-6-polyprenyl-1,4-benzoquinol methylase UbiE [Phycisphaerales bacterium JB037]